MKEKEFLEYIIKALVDEPDQVEINVVEGEKSTIFELKVAPSDTGKVIGKNGRIAKAIRTILNAAIAKSGKRITLDILG
ncbi:MAG: RNA-binding protein [Spirochaetes bacterium]|nr:MAG: RNA-binding protein [Spirochaetota bacterium]